jgi:hypothetical protein
VAAVATQIGRSGAEKELFMLRLWHQKGLLGLYLTLVLVFLFLCSISLAQTGSTSLRGTVTDTNGASVPDATVTITSVRPSVSVSPPRRIAMEPINFLKFDRRLIL